MYVTDKLDDPKLLAALSQGAVGVVPTDTLYGLVCRAADQTAVARLYQLKNREHKPGTVIAASIDQLVELGIPRRYLTAVEQFWPNPLSIIVASTPQLAYLDMHKMSLAVRIPKQAAIKKLLENTGPLLTSSANAPGQPPAHTIDEARVYFGDSIDFYVDGGDLSDRQNSTIIRIIDDAVEVIREGVVNINEKGEIEQ